MPFFVAVHCGAGFHAPRLEAAYQTGPSPACHMMAAACKAAAGVLAEGGGSMEAAVAGTLVLEDSPITNAGLGSNLNEDGFVECDASVMAGDGCFGAVGACPGVKNPVQAAHQLAEESRRKMPLQRVRPIFLGGDGARAWARKRGLTAAASLEEARQWNISDGARRQWQRYSKLIAEEAEAAQAETSPGQGTQKRRAEVPLEDDVRFKRRRPPASGDLEAPVLAGALEDTAAERGYTYDTVGCICIDACGRCAATVSSGGIAVKAPGRIGEAAVHGSGCWASDSLPGSDGCATACSITGVGEAIMQAALARTVCLQLEAARDELPADVCALAIQQHILERRQPGPPLPPDCGVLVARVQRHGRELVVDFGTAHSSQSLACAYFASGAAEPVCRIDRCVAKRPPPPPPGLQMDRELRAPSTSTFGCRARWPLS